MVGCVKVKQDKTQPKLVNFQNFLETYNVAPIWAKDRCGRKNLIVIREIE